MGEEALAGVRPARPRRLGRRRGRGHDHPAGRAVRQGPLVPAAGQVAPAPARQVARPVRRRHPLPAPLRRPHRERGGPPGLRDPLRRHHGHPPVPRRPGLRRGGDAGAAPGAGRGGGQAVRHPPQRPRHGPLPADRPRAVPEAADRGRLRTGLRDRPGLPQRGAVHPAQPRVHDARGLRGLRRLHRHDDAHRGAGGPRRPGGDGVHRASPSGPTASRSTSPRRGPGARCGS